MIRPGYLERGRTTESWTDRGLRDKVGAEHWPLPALLGALHDAGLTPDGYAEGGHPVPTTFSVRAVSDVAGRYGPSH